MTRLLFLGLLAASSGLRAQSVPKHIVIIGVDGMGSAGILACQREGVIPNLEELRKRGAWTLKARAVMPTVSSPNWASLVMGAGPEQHGITSNDWQRDKFEIEPVCKGSEGHFPTIFGLLREQRPKLKIAVIHDWDGFGRLIEQKAPDLLRHVKGGSKATTDFAIEHWKQARPDLLFVHLDDVDHAGHEHTWESAAYRKSIADHDILIGRFVAMAREAGVLDQTLFIVTADHGGVGKKHGGATMAEIEIPWIMAGPGVRAREITGAVNIQDTAATLASIYRIKTPACWDAKAIPLR
jgi:predicted AlkP superfamily pyrophosphatase or phosphodiesterase